MKNKQIKKILYYYTARCGFCSEKYLINKYKLCLCVMIFLVSYFVAAKEFIAQMQALKKHHSSSPQQNNKAFSSVQILL